MSDRNPIQSMMADLALSDSRWKIDHQLLNLPQDMERIFSRQQSQIESLTEAARSTLEVQGGLSRVATKRAYRRLESAQRLVEILAKHGEMSRAEQEACVGIARESLRRMRQTVGVTNKALVRQLARPSSGWEINNE